MSPYGTVLFHITPDSINEMLHLKPNHPLTPLSMKHLLDQGSKLSSDEIRRVTNLFMSPDSSLETHLLFTKYISMKLGELSLT